ncbi:bifunctional methylenetetrahydrofolate dehydrogenase/methenyltetrahydrofolate cyclohydrolase FolD [Buchnera aphidicola (Shivaphis celti)]
MKNKIMYSKNLTNTIIKNIKKTVQNETRYGKRPPGLAVIWMKNNTSTEVYIKNKKYACKKVGFYLEEWILKNSTSEKDIINLIKKLNKNDKIDGILIQLPLQNQINTRRIIEHIHPKKDIDGFHPYNIGCLCQKNPKLRPCTPKGIISLLKEYKIEIKGLNALVIGASNIVGRPMSLELLLAGCTTTITHRFTINLNKYIKNADLIIVAVGKPNFLDQQKFKKNAIIIDVGINKISSKDKIVGDVNFDSVLPKVSYITPVPGGVGPMTVVTLLQNTLDAYQNKHYYHSFQ